MPANLTRMGATDERRQLRFLLERELVRSVYQPIVELDSGSVVAYEALARGPQGSKLEAPDAMFAAARRAGHLFELEWACRTAAIQGALDADLGSRLSLFVNMEPSVIGSTMPQAVERLFRAASRKLRLVIELTERDLGRRPASLLALVRWARENWWGIALDDVGAAPESLAFLPFLNPDVIKLDMRLLHEPPSPENEAVVEAVRAHAARTGATILAEGIENTEHAERAVHLGASLGQGWHYGRPVPLEDPVTDGQVVRLLSGHDDDNEASALQALADAGRRPAATPGSFDDAVRLLADAALADQHPPVVLACVGRDTPYEREIRTWCARLAPKAVFVSVLGTDAGADLDAGIRRIVLQPRDPLAEETLLTVVTPEVAGAVVAAGPSGATISLAEDRDAVLSAARLLMSRVTPANA